MYPVKRLSRDKGPGPSVCPAALEIPWEKEEGGGASTRYIAQGGRLHQIQCRSVNTHRGKHRPGGAQRTRIIDMDIDRNIVSADPVSETPIFIRART